MGGAGPRDRHNNSPLETCVILPYLKHPPHWRLPAPKGTTTRWLRRQQDVDNVDKEWEYAHSNTTEPNARPPRDPDHLRRYAGSTRQPPAMVNIRYASPGRNGCLYKETNYSKCTRTTGEASTLVPRRPNFTSVQQHHQRQVWLHLFSYSNVQQETTTDGRESRERESACTQWTP